MIKPSQQEFERPAQQLSSGLILGLIQVIFAVSYAALMFSGRLSSYMAYAMTATLITAAAGGLYGLFSQEPTFVSGPESGTSSVLAGVMIGLAAVPHRRRRRCTGSPRCWSSPGGPNSRSACCW